MKDSRHEPSTGVECWFCNDGTPAVQGSFCRKHSDQILAYFESQMRLKR